MRYPSELDDDYLLFGQHCNQQAYAMYPKDRPLFLVILEWTRAELAARLSGRRLSAEENKAWESKYLEARRALGYP